MPSDLAPLTLTELFDRFQGMAYSLARRIVADDTLAEDVLQEVFLFVWRKPDSYDPARGGFTTWLMTLVHHRSVDAVRREQSQRDRQARAMREMTAEPAFDIPDTADAVCQKADAMRVRTALSALPSAQRQALALAYYHGFTQTEIARFTGTPLGTVKSRMFTGMVRLRQALRDGVPAAVLAGA